MMTMVKKRKQDAIEKKKAEDEKERARQAKNLKERERKAKLKAEREKQRQATEKELQKAAKTKKGKKAPAEEKKAQGEEEGVLFFICLFFKNPTLLVSACHRWCSEKRPQAQANTNRRCRSRACKEEG